MPAADLNIISALRTPLSALNIFFAKGIDRSLPGYTVSEVIFLLISLIRAVILLVTVVVSLRLMGKRQIGELQPTELVVTILLSEFAAVPMQDNDIPMINTLVGVCVLVGAEVLLGAAAVKSERLRSVLEGNAVLLVKDGKPVQKNMKQLRYNLDDLLEALRQKDVFDIADVQYAYAETNGSLSVLLKPEKRPLSCQDAGVSPPDTGVAGAVVMDGRIIRGKLSDYGVTEEQLRHMIKKAGVKQEDIFLLTVNKQGTVNLIEREREL